MNIDYWLLSKLMIVFNLLQNITPKCFRNILNDIFCVLLVILRLLFGDIGNILKR